MQSAPPALPQIACDTVNIIFSTQHQHAKNLSTRFAAPRGILRRDVVASATLRRPSRRNWCDWVPGPASFGENH
jgi:hypothetical protein